MTKTQRRIDLKRARTYSTKATQSSCGLRCKTAGGRYKVDPSSRRIKRNVDEIYTTLSIVVALFCELLCSEYEPRGGNRHKFDRRAARAARGANNGLYSIAPW